MILISPLDWAQIQATCDHNSAQFDCFPLHVLVNYDKCVSRSERAQLDVSLFCDILPVQIGDRC